jgi:hypothetical protein
VTRFAVSTPASFSRQPPERLRSEEGWTCTMTLLGVHVAVLLGKTIDDPMIREFRLNASMMPHEDGTCCSLPRLGIALLFDGDQLLQSIQLYGPGRDPGFAAFGDALPRGLKFSDSRADVLVKLGRPETQGTGIVAPILGKRPPWSRYAGEGHELLLQFRCDESAIGLVEIIRVS